MHAGRIAGLLLGVSGAACLILLGGKDKAATHALQGDLFVFLNATSYALYLILVKPLIYRYRPVVVIRWIFLLGFLFVLPFGWHDFTHIQWSDFGYKEYSAVFFIVVACTFFTYLWNIYALRILSPATAGAYIYLQPAFAASIAVLFYHEELSWVKLLASALICAGVYLVSWRRKSHD
jgi:drug/metabolite transporter (DMT)-like permease